MGAFVSKQPYSYQGCGAVTDAVNVLDLQYDNPTNNGPTECQDTCIANSRAASLLLDGKCYCSKDGITSIEFAADPPPDEQLCTISCSEVLPPIISGLPPISLPCGGYDNGVPPFNFPHINLFNFLLHFIIIPGLSFLDIICNLLFHVFILRYNFIGVTFNSLFYNSVTLRFFFVDVNFHPIFYLIVVLEFFFFDIVFKLLYTIILYNFYADNSPTKTSASSLASTSTPSTTSEPTPTSPASTTSTTASSSSRKTISGTTSSSATATTLSDTSRDGLSSSTTVITASDPPFSNTTISTTRTFTLPSTGSADSLLPSTATSLISTGTTVSPSLVGLPFHLEVIPPTGLSRR
ncbi:hypothetical protein CMEL01_12590 [Colletotrichum melonis]|uniref:WSC domain-containing protein n=1 Tax=Colletotrichum melonis TaxID=1209925 RepID=A0AAI9UVG2_9PEZI|nr:hypothetical protein CMEL01_12590 [Colletotrichum melonis]